MLLKQSISSIATLLSTPYLSHSHLFTYNFPLLFFSLAKPSSESYYIFFPTKKKNITKTVGPKVFPHLD